MNTNKSKKTLVVIETVATYCSAIDAVYDDDGEIIVEYQPERWILNGKEIIPSITLPCLHGWEGDIYHVTEALTKCWAIGIEPTQVLELWFKCGWLQVDCILF
jgi:hypothetical protein